MIIDDPNIYLGDFGVPVTAGGVTGLAILDMPSVTVIDGNVITTDYKITVRSDLFGGLRFNDAVTVDGVGYLVREPLQIGDGLFTEITLTKLDVVAQVITTLSGLRLTTLDGRLLVTL